MSFTDAAEWVLERSGHKTPMHYRAITQAALDAGAIATAGQTPEATMYAQILQEISRQQQRGETPRFVKHGKGLLSLSRWQPTGLEGQIEQHNTTVREALHRRLAVMAPKDFEALVRQLLVALGFEDTEVTSYSGDGGIDARGTLVGITRGTTRAHIARAVVESMAFQTRDAVDAMVLAAGRPQLPAPGFRYNNGEPKSD